MKEQQFNVGDEVEFLHPRAKSYGDGKIVKVYRTMWPFRNVRYMVECEEVMNGFFSPARAHARTKVYDIDARQVFQVDQ